LRHLGIRPGEKIHLDLLPGNRAQLSAERPSGSWDRFVGSLQGKTDVKLTIEEINEAIAEAGAAAGLGEEP
jgi:hypothetical protein